MNFLKKAFLTAATAATLTGCYVQRPHHRPVYKNYPNHGRYDRPPHYPAPSHHYPRPHRY